VLWHRFPPKVLDTAPPKPVRGPSRLWALAASSPGPNQLPTARFAGLISRAGFSRARSLPQPRRPPIACLRQRLRTVAAEMARGSARSALRALLPVSARIRRRRKKGPSKRTKIVSSSKMARASESAIPVARERAVTTDSIDSFLALSAPAARAQRALETSSNGAVCSRAEPGAVGAGGSVVA
jgi:hypothetical protein